MPQPGFLDLDNRYAKLDGGGDPLVKIKSNIIMPTELPGNPVAEFDVGLLPGGDILSVRLRKSSGFTKFDNAVESAIVMSRPLPVPPDPLLFPNFRNLSLQVHYLE
jgi:colicin import membrane protein